MPGTSESTKAAVGVFVLRIIRVFSLQIYAGICNCRMDDMYTRMLIRAKFLSEVLESALGPSHLAVYLVKQPIESQLTVLVHNAFLAFRSRM